MATWIFAVLFLSPCLHAQLNQAFPLLFNVTASNPQVRVQGITEVVGDTTISASAAIPFKTGAAGDQVVFQLFYNTNLSNAPVAGSGTLQNQSGTLSSGGVSVTFSDFDFQGGTTTLSWAMVSTNEVDVTLALSPNATLVTGTGGRLATIRVTGIRVNASQLENVDPAHAFVFFALTAKPQSAVTVPNNGVVLHIATLAPGLGASVTTPKSTASAFTFNLVVSEGFAGAFTTRIQETQRSGSEVTQGTRITTQLNNVPVGVSFLAPEAVSNAALFLTLVQNGAPLSAPSLSATRAINPVNGVATIEYEVTGSSPGTAQASALIPITAPVAAIPGPVVTAPFSGAFITLGPTSVVSSPSSTAPIPRFAFEPGGGRSNLMVLSQNSFVFTAAQDSPKAQQSFQIFNFGQGALGYSLSASTTGGGNWLSVSPTSGTSDNNLGSAAPVTVQVNPAGLAPGNYYGLVTITGPAFNSPQVANVNLQVVPSSAPPSPAVSPAGLIFTATEGVATLTSANVSVANTGGGTLSPVVTATTVSGGNWLSPGFAILPGGGYSIAVQVSTAGLAAGIYRGTVTVSAGVTSQDVAVILVVSPPGTVANKDFAADTTCTPTSFDMVSTLVPNNFTVLVGWPVPLLVHAVDNCKNDVTTATIVASLGSQTVALNNLRNGFYQASLTPFDTTQTTISLQGVNAPMPQVSVVLKGSLSSTPFSNPRVAAGGVVNAASFTSGVAVSPGSIISIFGQNLAAQTTGASLPLPKTLGSASVKLGDQDALLFYASPAQLNALVPQELLKNTEVPVIVTVNGQVSPPALLAILPVQPAIFFSGQNRAAVLDASNNPVSPGNPAAGLTVIQIFATGLGPTDPALATGALATTFPISLVTAPVRVTIGGVNAPVTFAGLAPGFTGLYQVNAFVPQGLSGDVPLVMTVNGVSSNSVLLAVR